MKRLALFTLSLCCMAAPIAAQDSAHRHQGQKPHAMMGDMDDMMPMMREMMAPMMRAMAYAPGHLLARKDSLKLTADQVTRLTTIQTSAKAAHDAAAENVKPHLTELSQAFQAAAPDTAALRTHFVAAHDAMGKAHWAMLAAAAEARAVLTVAQRQQVDAWVNTMQQRMEHEHTQ
jgi:hypothetical protein